MIPGWDGGKNRFVNFEGQNQSERFDKNATRCQQGQQRSKEPFPMGFVSMVADDLSSLFAYDCGVHNTTPAGLLRYGLGLPLRHGRSTRQWIQVAGAGKSRDPRGYPIGKGRGPQPRRRGSLYGYSTNSYRRPSSPHSDEIAKNRA